MNQTVKLMCNLNRKKP